MSKHLKLLSAALTAVILCILVAIVMLAISLFSYARASSTFPEEAMLTLYEQEDGSLLLCWPEADRADSYLVELLFPVGGQPVDSLLVTENCCVLPELPRDLEYTIRVTSQHGYIFFWQACTRDCKQPLLADSTLRPPELSSLSFETDPESQSAVFDWSGGENDLYRLYLRSADGSLSLLRTPDSSRVSLSFGSDGDLEMPGLGEEYTFVLDAYRESDGLVFYGLPSEEVTLARDDLLGTSLLLKYTDTGDNSYELTWNEVKGERYELQLMDSNGQWVTLREYSADDELVYCTGHLESFSDYPMRVVAYGEESLPDSEFSASPGICVIYTRESTLYAAVWPLLELELYADTDRQELLGTVSAAAQLCVLEEKDGMFYVRTDDGCGYIDSTYCLIDLADYLGSLCAYDITNSYSSIYMIHEYAIPEVTDTVVEGYENVALCDGSYLVPLIYPAAQKLLDAALTAQEDGYRLKIYDSYRPLRATRSIYDLTSLILSDPIPEETFSGEPVDDLPELPQGQELTYGRLMTDGTHSLGSFLASKGSYHNIGIALDLTLERIDTCEELEMQSSMHDLSQYSVLSRNNENALLLSQYMTAAGFNGISSEWWHFQDDESRIAYGINNFMWSGVSPEGWMADDGGWKYRRDDGSYYISTTASISGVLYAFDENGYVS